MNRQRLAYACLFFAFAGLLYFPAVTQVFLFRDDYLQLFRFTTHHYRFPANALIEGRPLYWLGVELIYPFLHDSADFSYLRLLNILLIGAFGVALHRLLIRYGWNGMLAFWLVLLTLTLPCFGVIAGWAATFQIILGMIAGLVAGHFALGETRRDAWLSAGLLLSAFCLYQSAAMMFWLVTLIACMPLSGPAEDWEATFRRAICRFFPVLILYFVGYKLALHFFGDWSRFDHQLVRTAMETDYVSKLGWFVTHPLADALQLMYLPPSELLVTAMVFILVSGGSLYIRFSSKHENPLILFLLFCLIMAYLPVLMVSERNDEYRLQIVLAPMIAYLFALSLYALCGRKPMAARLLLMTLALSGGLLAHYQFLHDFVTPQLAHREHILSQLRPLQAATPDTIYYEESGPRPPARHEYGAVTSEADGTLHVLYWEISGRYALFKSKRIGAIMPPDTNPVIHLY